MREPGDFTSHRSRSRGLSVNGTALSADRSPEMLNSQFKGQEQKIDGNSLGRPTIHFRILAGSDLPMSQSRWKQDHCLRSTGGFRTTSRCSAG